MTRLWLWFCLLGDRCECRMRLEWACLRARFRRRAAKPPPEITIRIDLTKGFVIDNDRFFQN